MSVTDYRQALTTAGRRLSAKIQAGNGKVPLDITRAVISEDKNGDPLNMAVSDVVITLNMDIMSREIIEGVRAVIKVKATNIGNPFADPPVPPVMKSFLLRRIFFFANDPDDGEIVYRVSQYSSPNYVPTVTLMPWTLEKSFNFTIHDASDVTVTVDPKGLATMKYVNEAVQKAIENIDPCVVFSAERPPGNWTLWLQDLGEIDDTFESGDTLELVTAPIDSPGEFTVEDETGEGETVLNMTDNPQTAGQEDIILADQ